MWLDDLKSGDSWIGVRSALSHCGKRHAISHFSRFAALREHDHSSLERFVTVRRTFISESRYGALLSFERLRIIDRRGRIRGRVRERDVPGILRPIADIKQNEDR
jgi:hypothetical protein